MTRVVIRLVAALTLACATIAWSQSAIDFERDAIAAFNEGDFESAAAAFREQIGLDPDNFVPRYNLAAALARLGELDDAMRSLERSIELGMSDPRQIRGDRDLAPLRGRDDFRRILDNWPAIAQAQRNARLQRDATLVRRVRTQTAIDELKVDLISGSVEGVTDIAADQVARVAAWTEEHLGFEPPDDDDAWVVVALPQQAEFHRWSVASLGANPAGVASVGGAYEHDRKRLVTRDISSTLRHEFVHVLHWRDMTRRGQRHPLWIQEGLAALVEDYDAPFTLTASWRTNIVKRNADRNRLLTMEELTERGRRRLTGTRSLANYAQSREVMRYLLTLGSLRAWYETYTADAERGYDADPSGVRAIEHATGLEIATFERQFEAWIEGQPFVPEDLTDLGVTLGFDVSNGAGDGPRVDRLSFEARRETGLRQGDVILSINGEPVGELLELTRRLSGLRAGTVVEVGYRRGRLVGGARVRLLSR
ncbi:MAG: tetratricopeptide repeat protein [Planctomycetota bacterium]